MIQAIVIDDDIYALKHFKRLANNVGNLMLLGEFEDYKAAIKYLEIAIVDSVFLDIEMGSKNGINVANIINSLNKNINIVFITSHRKYAVEAFEVNAADYILKPVNVDRLNRTVERLCQIKNDNKHTQQISLRVKCFGKFVLYRDNGIIYSRNSKSMELLAFLIHNVGVPVGWEKIVDAIWPEYDSEKAHANFHSTFYLLRKFLSKNNISDIISYSRGNYQIITEKISCDMYEFERLFQDYKKNLNIKSLDSALDLYKGGYFEEDGYSWAYSKAAVLENDYNMLINA